MNAPTYDTEMPWHKKPPGIEKILRGGQTGLDEGAPGGHAHLCVAVPKQGAVVQVGATDDPFGT